jgi:Family of unknown function (DUF6496)
MLDKLHNLPNSYSGDTNHAEKAIIFFPKIIYLIMKKKKLSPSQKKIAAVMHEFKAGELHSGKTDVIVTNPKQAIAIALSEAEELGKIKKKDKN